MTKKAFFGSFLCSQNKIEYNTVSHEFKYPFMAHNLKHYVRSIQSIYKDCNSNSKSPSSAVTADLPHSDSQPLYLSLPLQPTHLSTIWTIQTLWFTHTPVDIGMFWGPIKICVQKSNSDFSVYLDTPRKQLHYQVSIFLTTCPTYLWLSDMYRDTSFGGLTKLLKRNHLSPFGLPHFGFGISTKS